MEKTKYIFDTTDLECKSNVLFAYQLADLAYKNESEIRRRVIELCGTNCKVDFLFGENIFGFIVDFRNVLFISFRGSQTIGDWISNFDIRLRPAFCGHVHYGFSKALESIPVSKISSIIMNINGQRIICLTGHSRGGALAVLAAALIKRNGYNVTALYTYGQPRVGAKTFAQWWYCNMDCIYLRIVNGYDIVASLPPEKIDLIFIVKTLLFVIELIVTMPFFVIAKILKNLIKNKHYTNGGII
jgi:hypothetical protein